MSKADRVSEHDFLLRFLDDGNNQTECIVYLTIKKYFLVVFRMIINICKNLIEFFISLILIFELFQFYCADSFNESCVVNQEVSHLHEGISTINIIWVLVFLILYYLFMTMYCTPYNALISEFGKTQEDRMYISTAISLTFFFGTLISYLPFVFASFLQSAVSYAWSYRILFIILAFVALICMLIPCFKLKERDFVDAAPSESNAMKSLAKTFKNQNFRRFAASDVAYWIGLTLFQTGLPFFVKVSMQLDEFYTTVFLGGMTVLSACFYPFVSKLVSRHGKKKLVVFGFFGLALAYVITALIGLIPGLTGIVPGILIVIVAAFPMALLGIIPQAIVADVAEQDSVLTGEKREGMFFAARTFAMKFGQSIAMLVFTSLAVLGTTQDLTSNDLTASPVGLRIVAIAAVVFCILGAVILLSYDEKKVMNDITSHKS